MNQISQLFNRVFNKQESPKKNEDMLIKESTVSALEESKVIKSY